MSAEISRKNAAANSTGPILSPKNPGEGLLGGEDWVRVASKLRLTARELSVAILIFEGMTRFQIAQRLNRAPGTIRVYIDRLFAKLNVEDRLGVVLRIMRIHLGSTDEAEPAARRTKVRLE